MLFNSEDLKSLIAECINWFKNSSITGDEDYLLTQELLYLLRNQQIQQENIQTLQSFLQSFNYYNLDKGNLWNNTISNYVNNLTPSAFTFFDAILPVLLSWQIKRFQNENFIRRYNRDFQNFVNMWKDPVNQIAQQLQNFVSFKHIPNLGFFTDYFLKFQNLLIQKHNTQINEPVMIAKILHYLRPDIFIAFDNPIMNLLGLPVNEKGFSALNIWVYNFRINNIILSSYLENSYRYPLPRLFDMVLWCGANNKIEHPIWKDRFYSFINYVFTLK